MDSRDSRYQDIDDAVYEWYRLARERLVPESGLILQSEVLLLVSGAREWQLQGVQR